MSKTALTLSLLLLLFVGALGFVFYLSYGVKTSPPSRLQMSGLDDEVTIQWKPDGPVHIRAESIHDFYSALGYTHGMNQPWFSLLLREAALGQLGEWFGSSAWPEDRLSKKLQLGAAAKRAFETLTDGQKELLERYANGMNAAFASKRVARKAPMVLLEIEPDPWEPWHSIAIERLWAWLAVPEPEVNLEFPGTEWFQSADRALRTRLHAFGLHENVILLVGGGEQQRHLYRYVTGDSGQPVFQAFSYASSSGPVFDGLSVPGTFLFPAGRTNNTSWTFLLRGSLDVYRDSVFLSHARPIVFDRILDISGFEEVVPIEMGNRALAIDDAGRSDSVRVVAAWSGFTALTDAGAWLSLSQGQPGSLNLLREDGIFSTSKGTSRISGTPKTAFRHPNGVVLATNSSAGSYLVRRMQEIISGRSETQSDWDLLHDTESVSAADWNASFLAALDSLQVRTVKEDEAVEYLRNWDRNYRASSIAASIAEFSDRAIRASGSDSLTPAVAQKALSEAVLALTRRYGPDLRTWRWETVQEISLFYPGWKAETGYEDRRVRKFHSEFEPVSVVGYGHPSTLSWGPSIESHWRKASSAWEGLFGVTPGSVFEMERPVVRYTTFLGRFLAENHALENLDFSFAKGEYDQTHIGRKP